jgi:hypothetical protein
VLTPKLRAIFLLAALTFGVQADAQYITGEEQPLRPDPIPAGHTVQQPAEPPATGKKNKKTQKKGEQPAAAEQPLPSTDNLEAYTAAQIVEQAQLEAAAKQEAAQKAAEQAAQAQAAAKAAAEQAAQAQAAAQSAVQDTQVSAQNGDNQTAEAPAQGADSGEIPVGVPQDDTDNIALLPVERLTPPPPPTETVIVEQAIYRCPQGKGYIYVDADARKGRGRCTLYRAAKTEEVPIGSQPEKSLSGGSTSCSGTINYKGNTYLFRDGIPCPIPDNIFRRLTPAASSR